MKLAGHLLLCFFSCFFSAAAFAVNQYHAIPGPNPLTISFPIHQPQGNVAHITFPTSTLPMKFACYFSAQEINAAIVASITSTSNPIEFLAGTNETMKNTDRGVKIFTVKSSSGVNIGSIDITLDKIGTPSPGIVTILCSMTKANHR